MSAAVSWLVVAAILTLSWLLVYGFDAFTSEWHARLSDRRSAKVNAEWDALMGAVKAGRADVDAAQADVAAWLDFPSETPMHDEIAMRRFKRQLDAGVVPMQRRPR